MEVHCRVMFYGRRVADTSMNVRYFDEFKWAEEGDGTIWLFRDDSGEHVAEVALHDPDGV